MDTTHSIFVQFAEHSHPPSATNHASLQVTGRVGHGAAYTVAVLPDGRFVTGGGFGILVHDPASLAVTARWGGLSVHEILTAREGGLFVRGLQRGDDVIARLDLASGAWTRLHHRSYKTFIGGISDFGTGLAPDGKTLYLGEEDGSISVLDLVSGAQRRWLEASPEIPLRKQILFSPSGQVVAVCGYEHKFRDLDPRDLRLFERGGKLLSSHYIDETIVAFVSETVLLWSGSAGLGTVDLQTGQKVRGSASGASFGHYDAAALSPDGRYAVQSDLSGAVSVYQLPALSIVGESPAHRRRGWSSNGVSYQVIACTNTHAVVLGKGQMSLTLHALAHPQTPLARVDGLIWGVRSLSAADDLSQLFFTTIRERSNWEVNTAQGTIREQEAADGGNPHGVLHSSCLAGDGTHALFAAGSLVGAKMLRLRDGSETQEIAKLRTSVRLLRWSEDSSHHLVSHGANDEYPLKGKGELELRKRGAAKIVRRFSCENTPWDAELSPDLQRLALVEGSYARLFLAPKWKEAASVLLSSAGCAVALHPTERRFAASNEHADKQARYRLWLIDARGAGLPKTTQRYCAEMVSALCFSADGALLFAGDEHGRITIYDGATLQVLGSREEHTEAVTVLRRHPRGLLSAARDGQILLWGSAGA